MPTSITIILSPYHVGLHAHRVGAGPTHTLSQSLTSRLSSPGVPIHLTTLPPVDDQESEIRALPCAPASPRIRSLSSCRGTAMDTPDTNTNGYSDAMGLSMLAGKSWKAHMRTVPGFERPAGYGKMLYVGLRDVTEGQRRTVEEAGAKVVWGGEGVEWLAELEAGLREGNVSPSLVHLALDVLDEKVGKVNGFESPGGLSEEDLVRCMSLVPRKADVRSLTVCSFNPNMGDGDKIAGIAARAIVAFTESLIDAGTLVKKE
ncbi:hypothetical protein KVT40_007902 [Elsinoe batatas]|uniref:Arginase n=1 Tax=Elsinoe batatas TaxID=2601811 RepID=A0A8K0KZQ1_9PEZI|nr:hypothetical protein KVT40_007902 [Elsinoe batatas]